MPIISEFEEILVYLDKYVAESRKSEFKRLEIKFPALSEFNDKECNNSTSQNAIYLQLVSKMYLLHDMVGMTDKLMSKFVIKRMRADEFMTLKQYFEEKDVKLLSNVILNLSDTKYVVVLSSLSYEIMDNLIQSDTITKAYWFMSSSSPVIIITNSVYQVQKNQLQEKLSKITTNDACGDRKSYNFETQLLQLLSAVTNVNKSMYVKQSYTFWVFKINKLMFGVLIPRYETQRNSLINVWPIVPVGAFYNPRKVINNLKIPENDKTIFMSIASSLKSTLKLNMINLKKEITGGITLPMLLQNRININTLYMTFFFEFLREKEHYQFALPNNDCASYLKCKHCNVIFNNIFEFVRHWWSIKQKLIFRCHLCDERMTNLSKLGAHYRTRHFNFLQTKRQKMSVKLNQYNSNSSFATKLSVHKNENYTPKLRQCPLCHICKEGLHFMRLHLRNEHMEEIIKLTLCKMKQTQILSDERVFDGLWRSTCQLKAIESPEPGRPGRGNCNISTRKYTREQFHSLFTYRVPCPLCNIGRSGQTERYTDWLVFLTHISRDHSFVAAVVTSTDHFQTTHAAIAMKPPRTQKPLPSVIGAVAATGDTDEFQLPLHNIRQQSSTVSITTASSSHTTANRDWSCCRPQQSEHQLRQPHAKTDYTCTDTIDSDDNTILSLANESESPLRQLPLTTSSTGQKENIGGCVARKFDLVSELLRRSTEVSLKSASTVTLDTVAQSQRQSQKKTQLPKKQHRPHRRLQKPKHTHSKASLVSTLQDRSQRLLGYKNCWRDLNWTQSMEELPKEASQSFTKQPPVSVVGPCTTVVSMSESHSSIPNEFDRSLNSWRGDRYLQT